jgi:HK97 family phage prohead protease
MRQLAQQGRRRVAPAGGEFRTVPFDISSSQASGDGLTFEGYAAVFGQAARISGHPEDFDEQIAPGAFRSVAAGNYPVLMFEHGRHPLIGTMPLGRITRASEDTNGLWIEARLTDNWLVQPVRDAIADEAIDGMSFRFTVNGDDGEAWEDRSGGVPLRTLINLHVPELGPVVFPAYEPTTASVRSALDRVPDTRAPVTPYEPGHEAVSLVHVHEHPDGHGRAHSHLHVHSNDNRHSGAGHEHAPGSPGAGMPEVQVNSADPGGDVSGISLAGQIRAFLASRGVDLDQAVRDRGYAREHEARATAARASELKHVAREIRKARRAAQLEHSMWRLGWGPTAATVREKQREVETLQRELLEGCGNDRGLMASVQRSVA